MPVKQSDVIHRLKSGETIFHVIDTVAGEHKPFQYLSGGGASYFRDVQKAARKADASFPRPIHGCRAAGMAVG